MSVYDQIRSNATQKQGYVDTSRMGRTVAQPRPRFNPRPASGPSPFNGGTGISPATGLVSLAEARQIAAKQGGGDDGFSPLGFLGSAVKTGFDTVLDVADTTRRAYQGVAGEIGDLVENIPGNNLVVEQLANTMLGNPASLRGLPGEDGQNDRSFDLGDIRTSITGDDAMSTGFLDRSPWTDDLPGYVKPVVGFAGDILTDPATYLTAGTVKGATTGLKAAARVPLASETVLKAVGTDVAGEVVDKLAREAGTRGLGAFTRKGLARSGATADDLAKLGMQTDFGYSVGFGRNARVAIPGTRRLAEASENTKGAIKAMTGSSRSGRLAREIGTSAKHGERVMKQAILSGSPDAATAARGLAVLGLAKGESYSWMDQTAHALAKVTAEDGTSLRKMHPDELKALTRAVDTGDMSVPMARELADFFEKAATTLKSHGVEFNQRTNYMPHRLSEQAIKMLNGGDEDVARLIDDSLDKAERFQKLRQSDLSISDVNAEWRKTHDYDLLETDAHVLLTQYLREGQEAILRSRMSGKVAQDVGLVKEMGQGVDGGKLAKAVQDAVDGEAKLVADSVKVRRQAADTAQRIVKGQRDEQAATVKVARKQLADSEANVVRLKQGMDRASTRLSSLELAEAQLVPAARAARGAEKAALTKRLNDVRRLKGEFAGQLARMQTSYDNAIKAGGSNTTAVDLARGQFDQAAAQVDELSTARKAADQAPINTEARRAQAALDKASGRTDVAREKFLAKQTETEAATLTTGWLKADTNQLVDKLTNNIAELDDWMERTSKAAQVRGGGRVGTAERYAQRDLLRDQMSELRQLLKGSTDPRVTQLAALEAQALQVDMAQLMAGRKARSLQAGLQDFNKGVDLLGDPKFQAFIVDQTDEGFDTLKRQLGDDMQVNEWYRDAYERVGQFQAPATRAKSFGALATFMKKYSGAMNWWKGWALSSPGFVLRNWYGGLFGMYLDDINPIVASKFSRYAYKAQREGVEAADAWALKKYGRQQAANLSEANKVAAASGWGITPEEAGRKLVGDKMSLNPLSSSNPYSQAIRKGSSEVESFLRGGHAFAVLQRGGSFQDALQRVEKFHFNYRDITDFDRAAKNVMPFWTFWSRNLGLQASVFAKKPQKITRSYYNAKRNIEEVSPDFGEAIPWYLKNDMAAIRTPFGSPDGRGQMSLTPDIPSIRFPGVAEGMADNPFNELLSMAGPAIKIPAQVAMNKDVFTGREYRNDLSTYDSTGEIPRLAPSYMQLPGVRNVADMLPGTELIDNQLLMSDRTEAAVEGVNPVLSRLGRFFPNNERDEETRRQYLINFLGGPVRWNDPGSQAGAMAAVEKQAEARADAVLERIRLEGLVSGQ